MESTRCLWVSNLYSTKIFLYLIQIVLLIGDDSDLRQAGGFLWVIRFPPPTKLTVRFAHLIFSWSCVCVFVCVPFPCLPNVASVSGLSIPDCPFGCLWRLSIKIYQIWTFLPWMSVWVFLYVLAYQVVFIDSGKVPTCWASCEHRQKHTHTTKKILNEQNGPAKIRWWTQVLAKGK
jgi:hypothetical protein